MGERRLIGAAAIAASPRRPSTGFIALAAVASMAAAPAWAKDGLVDVIGNSKNAYATASVMAALAPLMILAVVFGLTRGTGGRARRFAGGLALVGVTLFVLGVGLQVVRYKPFDGQSDALHLSCHPVNLKPGENVEDAPIEYDAASHCVNGKTIYEFNHGGLERIILYKAADDSTYEARVLRVVKDPYATPSSYRFTRVRARISEADYTQLEQHVARRFSCASANPDEVNAAYSDVVAMRQAFAGMSRATVQTTEWRCPDH
jgi:hypothetical protein